MGRRLLQLLQAQGVPCCDPTSMDVSAWWQAHANDLQVLVGAGGDGTISWLSHLAARHGFPQAVAPWPLGTGNDCARHLGWRARPANPAALQDYLLGLERAQEVCVDRWRLTSPQGLERSISHYCSIGRDARIAHAFHRLRQRHSAWFRSPLTNKGIYAACALMDTSRSLRGRLSLQGLAFPHQASDGLVWSNIPSYAGGSCLARRIRANDGQLNLHAYAGMWGLSLALSPWRTPRPIACESVYTFTCHAPVLGQCDGEPLILPPGTYHITPNGHQRMLRAS